MELTKQIRSNVVEIERSAIRFASYNPRNISDDGRRELKRSIKNFGVLGGIIVNRRTNNTIVGGHQKVAILDDINKYNPSDKSTDYLLRVELIDVDEKTEKEINITLNNPNVGGEWDFDKLRELIPDIDYKKTGLTDEDLNLIGCDYLLKTDEENDLAMSLSDMMAPVEQMKADEREQRKLDRAEKVGHMKDVKRQVMEGAQKKVDDMSAYIMLSFDSFEAKKAFCCRFGYDQYTKIIKGEVFDEQIEVVL